MGDKMAYQVWFQRRLDLLEEEINEFKEQELEFQLDEELLTKENKVVFNGVVDIHGKPVCLQLVYPAEFPAFPILVRTTDTSLDRHQHPFLKNLCVIPHTQDGWESQMTGAYMVKQAIRLLQDSEQGPEVVAANEVDAPEPWTNYLSFRHDPLIIPGNIPDNLPEAGSFEISLYNMSYRYVGLKKPLDMRLIHCLETIKTRRKNYSFDKLFPFQQQRRLYTIEGTWFKLDEVPRCNIENPEELLDFLQLALPDQGENINEFKKRFKTYKEKQPPLALALLFPEEMHERNRYRNTFLLGVYYAPEKIMVWSRPHFVTVEDYYQRIPHLRSLYEKKIFIVGLGSLGSAVALELGKCGVGEFVLLDHDLIEYGNVVRHTGNVLYLDLPKSKILEHQIQLHFPYARIESMIDCIGMVDPGSLSDGDLKLIYEKMENADLIINTAINEGVTKTLDRLATEVKKPIIHSWISNGAWGGRVIRNIPGKTGCYFCFQNSEPKSMWSSPEGEIYPRGCGFPTFAGTSYDIYEVATHTVRMAVDTLLGKDISYDHLLISHYPLSIKQYKIYRDDKCRVCGKV